LGNLRPFFLCALASTELALQISDQSFTLPPSLFSGSFDPEAKSYRRKSLSNTPPR